MSDGSGEVGASKARGSNRLGLDYRAQAAMLPPLALPRGASGVRGGAGGGGGGGGGGIIDIHAHINGRGAGAIYRDVAQLYGISRVYTQVRITDAELVRQTLGDMVRFIAFPNFRQPDKRHAFTQGYLDDIATFHQSFGARILKFWNAPRMYEIFEGDSGKDLIEFDSPWRVRQAELGQQLGMMFMVHVADPDTWFATRYKDASRFMRKIDHYRGLRVMLDRFKGPWIAAHMGGWPEDLAFLSEMLEKHPNLYLDTSATKWIVREISRHSREESLEFFVRWKGRILFGSDIVTVDEHLAPPAPLPEGATKHPMADLADSPASAFDLYASRYLALRMMFETGYLGESPIADPDLMMVDPSRFGPMDAPTLRGLSLPHDVLEEIYVLAARRVLAKVGVVE
jgi:hypothetical protein